MGATPVNFASAEDLIQNLAFVDNQLGKVWGAKSYLYMSYLASIVGIKKKKDLGTATQLSLKK